MGPDLALFPTLTVCDESGGSMTEFRSDGTHPRGLYVTASDAAVGGCSGMVPAAEVDTVADGERPASSVPFSRPVQLPDLRRHVVRDVLARLEDATNLAEAASVVDVCVPALADVAGVQLLYAFAHGDDAASLVPGARLLVRAPIRSRADTGVRSGAGAWPRAGGRGERWRPSRALTADSVLRVAMESQDAVRSSRLQPRSVAAVAADLDCDLSASALCGGELLAIPLICGSFTIGGLALARGPGRPPFSTADVETAQLVAVVIALRLDNLRLSARQAETAAALRSALLPVVPATLTGVEVGVRYRSARPDDGVGGDWLEAIRLPGGRTAFTVGDVMGHGIPAAMVMGVLLSAIQALAPMHLDPAQLLRQLDDLALQHQAALSGHPSWLATCLYAVYDPVTRECEIANAGHPAPMLTVTDGTSRPVGVPPGPPIGVGGGGFRTVRVAIPDGSQLTFYTDGLIEVCGQDIELGMTALGRRTSRGLVDPLERVCQDLLDQAVVTERVDDVALLVARFHGLPADQVAGWTFSADPELDGHAGRLTGRVLRRWRLGRLESIVVPLIDELVSHAVRHNAGSIALRLLFADTLLCEVSNTTGHLPVEQLELVMDRCGRGLRRLSARTRSWDTYRTATGQVFWFEYPLSG
jgi:serine phosphatase RsbU (regulator of sigma subunit)